MRRKVEFARKVELVRKVELARSPSGGFNQTEMEMDRNFDDVDILERNRLEEMDRSDSSGLNLCSFSRSTPGELPKRTIVNELSPIKVKTSKKKEKTNTAAQGLVARKLPTECYGKEP